VRHRSDKTQRSKKTRLAVDHSDEDPLFLSPRAAPPRWRNWARYRGWER